MGPKLISKQDCLNGLEAIEKLDSLQGKAPDERQLLLMLLKQIPMMTEFLKNLDETGSAVSGLDLSDKSISHVLGSADQLGKVFHGLSIGLAGIDVLRLFFIYMSRLILDRKIEFKLSREARLVYALAIMGLGIAALAVPYAAPVIIITAAALTLVGSTVTLGYSLYKIWADRRALKHIEIEIKAFEQDDGLAAIKTRAQDLKKAIGSGVMTEVQKEEYSSLQNELKAMQALYDRRAELQAKREHFNPVHLLDRGTGILLAAVALAGLILSIYFPPVGFGILAGAALIGATYIGGRLAVNLGKVLYHWLGPKLQRPVEVQAEPKADQPAPEEAAIETDSVQKEFGLLGVKPHPLVEADFQDEIEPKASGDLSQKQAVQHIGTKEDEDDDRDTERPWIQ